MNRQDAKAQRKAIKQRCGRKQKNNYSIDYEGPAEMNATSKFLSLLMLVGALFLVGCQQTILADHRPTWERFTFPYDQLLGVRIQQHPDNGDGVNHRGKHPAMVVYVIKRNNENRACQVSFSPDGEIKGVFWWTTPPEQWVMEQLKPLPSHQ